MSRISGSFLDLVEYLKYFKTYLDKLSFKQKKVGLTLSDYEPLLQQSKDGGYLLQSQSKISLDF